MQQLKIMPVDTECETYALLARNINTIRQAFHISVIELADYIGHNKHTVTLRLKCPWLFEIEDLRKIAELGGVTLEDLMFGDLLVKQRTVYNRKKGGGKVKKSANRSGEEGKAEKGEET